MAEAGSSSTEARATRATVRSRCVAERQLEDSRHDRHRTSSDARASSRRASSSEYPPTGTKRYGTSSCRNRETSMRAASSPSCGQLYHDADGQYISPHLIRPRSRHRPIPTHYSGELWILSSCKHACRRVRSSEGREQGGEAVAWSAMRECRSLWSLGGGFTPPQRGCVRCCGICPWTTANVAKSSIITMLRRVAKTRAGLCQTESYVSLPPLI